MRKRSSTEEGFQGCFEDLSNISIVKTSCCCKPNHSSPPPPIPGPRCNDKYKASPPSRGWIVAKPLNVLSLDTRNFQWIFHLAFLSSIRLCPLFGYVNGNRRANLILHDCWLSSLSINCDTFMGEDCSSRSIKFGDWSNFPSKDEIKLNTKSTVYS